MPLLPVHLCVSGTVCSFHKFRTVHNEVIMDQPHITYLG
jgi:hypothetical protein